MVIYVLAEDIYALYIDYTLNDIPESLKYNLLIVNKDGKILGKAFDMEDQIGIGMGGFSFFQRISNEEVLLAPGFENKIYTLTPDTLVPKYYIDFGENNVPYNFFSEGSKHEISNDLRETNFTYLSSYIETTDFLVFKFSLQGVLYNGIYCKKTGKYKIANIFMNDINMITGGPIMSSHGDNTIISMYEPRNVNSLKEIYTLSSDKDKLKSYLIKQFDSYFSNGKELIDYKAYRDELETTDFTITEDDIEFVNSINPGDNPILIIGNLKNF